MDDEFDDVGGGGAVGKIARVVKAGGELGNGSNHEKNVNRA
jgi:hypothetical protein